MRLCDAQAGAGGHHHHQAGLSPIFGGRRAFNDFHRLDGVDRQLIGEDLAHLVGNRLAVDRKRVRGVIAESVEKAVGIGRNPWRSERHQRTQRRRLAFERQLVKKVTIHIRVGGGSALNQIRAGLHGDRLRRLAEGQADLHLHGHGRPYVDVLAGDLKPGSRGRCGQMVVIVRKVIELELALAIGGGAATVVRDGVLNRDGGAGDNRSRRIEHRSVNRSAIGLSETRHCATKR